MWLLKRFSSEQLFLRMLVVQSLFGIVFAVGAYFHLYGLYATLVMFFLFLSCVGITSPNGSAMAMVPFSKNAGSAAAMLGFLQLGTGSVISSGIGVFMSKESFPLAAILAVTSVLGVMVLLAGRRKVAQAPVAE